MRQAPIRNVRASTIALLAILLPLAACHKTPEPAPEPENNLVQEAPAPPAPVPPPQPVAPPPKPKATVVRPPAPPPVAPDQQVLDDADATGMTARVPRDGGNER